MTELEHVEIEGFKGLEHVEFEPTDINLITGRNNTGKTSFLEAVDLLFNPANLEDFEDSLGSIVHTDANRSEIQGRTGESESRVTLRKPTTSETEEYLSELLPVSMSRKSSLPLLDEVETDDGPENGRDVVTEVGTLIRQTLNERLDQRLISGIQDEMLLFSINSDEYPYFLGGRESTSVMEAISKEIEKALGFETIVKKVGTGFGRKSPIWNLEIAAGKLLIGLAPESSYREQPENTSSATLIKSVNLTEDIERTNDEQEPIKIDDIGDFIKEKEVVDDLKTFTLDYLVFEENGEKRQIPYEFMGDGFKSIVGLLWELMDDNVENDIVLLEEPETHMHPGYIREVVYFLINLAREENVQLFITTHDSDFINDFFTENLTDEEEAYLEDEFSLLRMEEDSAVVEDYETARENLKDLHLDLRGI